MKEKLSDQEINTTIATHFGWKVTDTGRGVIWQNGTSPAGRTNLTTVLTDYANQIGNAHVIVRHLIQQADNHPVFNLRFDGDNCVGSYDDPRFDYLVEVKVKRLEHPNFISRAIAEVAYTVIKEITKT